MELRRFHEMDGALAKALGLQTSLKPEASILLELFGADRMGKKLTVSMLGLLDGIPQTTALRYIDLLDQHGALERSPHETDQRMRYVSITAEAQKAIEDAIESVETISSASYKPTA